MVSVFDVSLTLVDAPGFLEHPVKRNTGRIVDDNPEILPGGTFGERL